jgi:hypothetical protein
VELTFTAVVALIGWIPVVVFLFMLVPIRRALLATMVLGYLLLPQAEIELSGGLPDYTRMTAMSAGTLLALLILDFSRLARFRPSAVDIPIVVWCLVPMASSIANGLGAYDGVSAVITRTLSFGLFYLYGRIYLSSMDGLRQLAMALFLGALAYLPFCLYEIRMSPQLHATVYGFHQHSFAQTYRLGGWRPMVFLQHGLALGMFLCTSFFLGLALWRSGSLRRFAGFELMCLGALAGTAVFSRSAGAILLLLLALAVVAGTQMLRSPWPLLLLTLVPVGYSAGRMTGTWDGRVMVDAAASLSADRARSIAYRLDNEDLLIEKALTRPLLGWAGWGRSRVQREGGKVTVTDGYWILNMGRNGFVGLITSSLLYLLPAWLLISAIQARSWLEPDVVLLSAFAIYLSIYMVDNLLNAMDNPFTMLASGAVIGVLGGVRAQQASDARPALAILSTKELLQLSGHTLDAYAHVRWGQDEYARREQQLALAVAALDPNDWRDWRTYSELFRRLVLSLRRKQLDRFLGLPLSQKKGLALFLTGQGHRKPDLK